MSLTGQPDLTLIKVAQSYPKVAQKGSNWRPVSKIILVKIIQDRANILSVTYSLYIERKV